jgi:predicted ATPase
MEFSAHANIGDHQVEYSVAVTREGQVVRESLQGQGLPPDLCYRFPRDPKNWAPRSETLFHQCLREPVQYHDPRAAEIFRHMTHALKTVQYTLDPRALAKPSEPTKDAQEGPRLASNGEGLASVLEYLILVERAKFDRLEKQLHSMVDCVQELKVQPVSGRRQLAFRLSHAEEPVPASLVSDGLLLFLGYLALLCLPGKSPHTILIDEPENGIHPRRLKEIVGLLRTFCREQSVQVVLTTHSPCLLDWVEPGEVHILTRDDDLATRATRMSDVPDIDVLRKGYQLGELWFNDGEEDLIRGVK